MHGSLEDIEATRPDGRTPAEVGDGELVDAAVAAMADLLLLVRERTRERDQAAGGGATEAVTGLVARGRAAGARTRPPPPCGERRSGCGSRVDALEAELQEHRRLQLRVGGAHRPRLRAGAAGCRRDRDITAKALRRYRKVSL